MSDALTRALLQVSLNPDGAHCQVAIPTALCTEPPGLSGLWSQINRRLQEAARGGRSTAKPEARCAGPDAHIGLGGAPSSVAIPMAAY